MRCQCTDLPNLADAIFFVNEPGQLRIAASPIGRAHMNSMYAHLEWGDCSAWRDFGLPSDWRSLVIDAREVIRAKAVRPRVPIDSLRQEQLERMLFTGVALRCRAAWLDYSDKNDPKVEILSRDDH